jgi:hypothetical protein
MENETAAKDTVVTVGVLRDAVIRATAHATKKVLEASERRSTIVGLPLL